MATTAIKSSKTQSIDVTSFLAGKTGSGLTAAFATLSDFESKVEAAKSVASSLTIGNNIFTVAKNQTNAKVDYVYTSGNDTISFTTSAGLKSFIDLKAQYDGQIAAALAINTNLNNDKTALTVEKTALTAQIATIDNTVHATELDAFNAGKLARQAEIDAAVNSNFTLTTNIDGALGGTNFTGNSSNNTFSAALDNGVMTFTSLDAIDGGLGRDTFNVVTLGSLAGVVGATVTGIEVATIASVPAITAANVSSWTGLETVNVASAAAISGVVAASTTDINVASGLAGVSVNGGKNVTINNSTTGNIVVGATTAASGNVTATNSSGGNIDIDALGNGNVTATNLGGTGNINVGANTVTTGNVSLTNGAINGLVNVGDVNTFASGPITIGARGGVAVSGGSSLTVNATDSVPAAIVAADLATQATLTLVSNALGTAGTASVADVTAAAALTAANTMAAAIVAGTTPAGTQAATTTAYAAGAITLAQKTAIDNAYVTAFKAVAGTEALAEAAALAVYTPIIATLTANKANTASALTTATAATVAADAVVAADTFFEGLADNVGVAASSSILRSVSITGNRGAVSTITDSSAGGTLTTATLNDAGNTTFVTTRALTNVNLLNSNADVIIGNTTAGHTLNLGLTNVTSGTITDAAATGLAINSAGTANAVTLTAGLVTAASISGSGNFTGTFAGLNAAVIVNAANSSGTNTVTVAATQGYAGGSGVDVVTTGALQTLAVSGGAGSSDRLIITNAANSAATPAALFSGFEQLQANGVAVNASLFAGITSVRSSGSASITGLNATQAANITAINNGTNTYDVTGATTVGQLDTVSITANDGAAAISTVTLTTPTIAGVETLNLTAIDGLTVTSLTSVSSLTALNVFGAGAVSITTGALAMNANTIINASAATGAVTVDASLSTTNSASITGSATANNILTGSATLGTVLTGGAGNDVMTGGAAADRIAAGDGDNVVTAGAGNNVITAGNGNNVISSTTGNDAITVGSGYNTINAGAGADTIVIAAHGVGVINAITGGAVSVGTTARSVTVGGVATGDTFTFGNGVDVITGFNTGSDTLDLAAATAITGNGVAAAATVAAQNYLLSGSWNQATGVFTVNTTTGADTMVVEVGAPLEAFGLATQISNVVLVGVSSVGAANVTALDTAII